MAEKPEAFQGAVLNAPMMGLPLPDPQARFAHWFSKTACALGLSSLKLPGLDPSTDANWTKGRLSARLALLTSDLERLDFVFQYAIENPKLRMQPMTLGLVRYLFDSTRCANDERTLSKIKTPILMTVPSEDRVISQDAIRATAAKLPTARLLEI